MKYPKAAKYTDLNTIYAQVSGPGGLELAEFIADKLDLQSGKRLLDVGTNRGYQSCFMAKEYGVNLIGIDPWPDREDNRPHIEHLANNARSWGVDNLVLGLSVGLPDTRLPSNVFDYAVSATTLEMIRGIDGEAAYLKALLEIYRILKPGGLLGISEPMHLDTPLPVDLELLVNGESERWTDFFVTAVETETAVQSAGFEIIEADYAPDARKWWLEFARYDPFCRKDPEGEQKTIRVDNGRWLSFGYVIARKPA